MYNMSTIDQLKINFTAGATGLSVSYACMHPLDTIKTRIQADVTGKWRQVVFSRATVHSLGKGFFVSAMMAAGQGGFRYSTYEYSKTKLASMNRNKDVTATVTSISAIIGDLASSIIKVPREVITAKMQIDHYKSSASSYKNTSSASYVVRQTLLEEGPKGLFKGFWAIAARDSPFMIILLVTYEKLKSVHPFHQYHVYRNPQQQRIYNSSSVATIDYRNLNSSVVAQSALEEERKARISAVEGILYGGVSGFLAGYITTPMDVLRTRIIAQKASMNRQPVTVAQMLTSIISQNWNNSSGNISLHRKAANMYHTFFAGSISRSVWWFGVCGIFFPMYETLRTAMNQS